MEGRSNNVRHQWILELLSSQGQVFVQDLAEHFNVTQETIRRDLSKLESMKLLKKVHGGAVNVQSKFEQEFSERTRLAFDEKQAIARVAAEFIKPGDTLFIDFGTTTLEFAQQIKHIDRLTVITNSPLLAETVKENASIDIILVGGQLAENRYACLGPIALNNAATLYADYAVIGAGALDAERGIMDQNIDEAAMAKQMIENSHRVMVLADSGKQNKQAIALVARWKEIDIVVTGKSDSHWANSVRAQGVTVMLADGHLLHQEARTDAG